MADFDEQHAYKWIVQEMKNSVLRCICFIHYNEDEDVFDIEAIKKELAAYKPREVKNSSSAEMAFTKMLRRIEHNIVTHLSVKIKEEHNDPDKLAELFDILDIGEAVQGSAPSLPIVVVPRSESKTGKPVLTTFDSLKETVQTNLVLTTDREGRLVHRGTNLVFVLSSDSHYTCIGRKNDKQTKPLTPEDIALCKQNNWLYALPNNNTE
jgi:hypothetical protein